MSFIGNSNGPFSSMYSSIAPASSSDSNAWTMVESFIPSSSSSFTIETPPSRTEELRILYGTNNRPNLNNLMDSVAAQIERHDKEAGDIVPHNGRAQATNAEIEPLAAEIEPIKAKIELPDEAAGDNVPYNGNSRAQTTNAEIEPVAAKIELPDEAAGDNFPNNGNSHAETTNAKIEPVAAKNEHHDEEAGNIVPDDEDDKSSIEPIIKMFAKKLNF